MGAMLSTTSEMTLLRSRVSKIVVAACVLLVCILAATWFWQPSQRLHRLQGPDAVYWAWERPEDLRFLDPQKEAVAFLASSVELLPNRVNLYPRMQPLLLSPGTQLMAVVRIYSHPASPAALNSEQFEAAVNAAISATHQPNVSALQIDFDARSSERSFYSRLLTELRRQLGPHYPISITALASWCIGDRWIRSLPVDEAVPMLFSMGSEAPEVRRYLLSHASFPEPLCRGSLGVSTGEEWPKEIGANTRIYVFHPQSWTRESVETVRSRVRGKK
jgi:hypothetical protein